LSERFVRPGILLSPGEDQPPFREDDSSLLESKIEVKIGEDTVKKIDLSADGLQAYVELENEAGECWTIFMSSLGVASLSKRVWGQSRVGSLTMNMIKQERGWAQATTELAERERTSFTAALARFPCGHTFKGT
jgi:hypothetical protein